MARCSAAVVGLLAVLLSLCGRLEGKNFFGFTLEDLFKRSTKILDLTRARRLSGGTTATVCDYPGVVAVTFSGRVMCGGVHINGEIIVPNDCAEFLVFVTGLSEAQVHADGNDVTGAIASVTATDNNDGTTTIPLTTPLSPASTCGSSNYVPYDPSMTVDTSTCQILSYGGLSSTGHAFDGNLLSAPLVTNPLQGCCADVVPNLDYYGQHGTIDPSTYAYTCSKTTAGVCNGDTGAPIYCKDTASGSQVVVGMAATGSCSTSGEIFVSIDMTGGQLAGFSA